MTKLGLTDSQQQVRQILRGVLKYPPGQALETSQRLNEQECGTITAAATKIDDPHEQSAVINKTLAAATNRHEVAAGKAAKEFAEQNPTTQEVRQGILNELDKQGVEYVELPLEIEGLPNPLVAYTVIDNTKPQITAGVDVTAKAISITTLTPSVEYEATPEEVALIEGEQTLDADTAPAPPTE